MPAVFADRHTSHDGKLTTIRVNGDQILFASNGPMDKVIHEAELVAPTKMGVLIHGQTGTGKENLAHLIHNLSPRKDKPFVAIHCGAIPESLLESELFGHEKGAFTGADKGRIGKFEAAEGGTIFLDEIDKMPLNSQQKLLRAIQAKEFTRVGGTERREADVRIIAATNRFTRRIDGRRTATLLPDLFYRLSFKITVPALQDRPEDIPYLAEHFVTDMAKELGFSQAPAISAESMAALMKEGWRGNIRELSNCLKSATLRAGDGGEITPALLQLPNHKPKVAMKVEVADIGAIITTDSHGKRVAENLAATNAGVSRSTLRRYTHPDAVPDDTTANLLRYISERDGPERAAQFAASVVRTMQRRDQSPGDANPALSPG